MKKTTDKEFFFGTIEILELEDESRAISSKYIVDILGRIETQSQRSNLITCETCVSAKVVRRRAAPRRAARHRSVTLGSIRDS